MMSRFSDYLRRYRESAIDILILFLLVQAGSITYALLKPDDFRYLASANISVTLKSIPVLGVLSLGVVVSVHGNLRTLQRFSPLVVQRVQRRDRPANHHP